MKILLSSLAFKNNDISFNKDVILNTIKNNQCDLIIFGEMYLQGFMSLTFDYNLDKVIALNKDDLIIKEIREACKQNNVAISFGYAEKDNDSIYSAQITIDNNGEIINNYRRLSKGWKERFADKHYKEGNKIATFTYKNINFALALCGDLWDENILKAYQEKNIDILIWPLYVDYDPIKWNKSIKYEYASQAKRICDKVLIVNPYSFDRNSAKGGSLYSYKGKIIKSIDDGKEGCLLVEFN